MPFIFNFSRKTLTPVLHFAFKSLFNFPIIRQIFPFMPLFHNIYMILATMPYHMPFQYLCMLCNSSFFSFLAPLITLFKINNWSVLDLFFLPPAWPFSKFQVFYQSIIYYYFKYVTCEFMPVLTSILFLSPFSLYRPMIPASFQWLGIFAVSKIVLNISIITLWFPSPPNNSNSLGIPSGTHAFLFFSCLMAVVI